MPSSAQTPRPGCLHSKYRGRVDIWINGSYWAGAILGSFVSYIFLNHFAPK